MSLEELVAVGVVELRDLFLDRRADRHDFRAFAARALAHAVEIRIVLEAVFRDVGDVHQRLEREQEQIAHQRFLFVVEAEAARRLAFVETGRELLQNRHLRHRFLVVRLGRTLDAVQRLVDGVEIGQRQLGIDRFDVGDRIDLAGHVHDVGVLEAAHDVSDRVDFADVREELVAEPLALRRARDEAGDVDELDRRRNDFLRLHDVGERLQARIGHRHDADVRIDRAERDSSPPRCPPWSAR